MEWHARVARELEIADAANARRNEGMARVCARRAAGWAAEAYLQRRGQGLNSSSVLEQMRHLIKVGDLEPNLSETVERLLSLKQPGIDGGDSYFPADLDLVADARYLIASLFPDN